MGILDTLSGWFRPRSTAITTRVLPGPSDAVRGPMVLSGAGRLWEPIDRETALRDAESGNYKLVADLCDAMRCDGLIRGLLTTRTSGQWSLPVQYDGDPWVTEVLRGRKAEYSTLGALDMPAIAPMWERLLPLAEASAVVEDGIMAGAGIGYMEDDPSPGGWRRLKRLDLQWLTYVHTEDAFYYQSAKHGRLRVTPGDGRWVLFTPYGRSRPWARGAWYPCAGPFISKQGAVIDRTRWSKFLADGLRWIKANENASELHLSAMVQFIRQGWSYAPGIALPKGYEPGITESQGKGYEVYTDTEERADREIQVALAGQLVTVDGTAGFSSGDVWRDIAAAIIGQQAKAASEWITTDVLDPWTKALGLGAGIVSVSWDTRDPSQRKAASDAAKAAAESIKAIDEVAKERGQRVRIEAFFISNGVDVELEPIDGPKPTAALPESTSHVSVAGIPVIVEHPKGSMRTGVGPDLRPWSTRMVCDYGSIPGTHSPDGEPVDAYVGPDDKAPFAFVVTQNKPDGTYDEPKVMLGFDTEQEALWMYRIHVPHTWAFGGIEAVPVAELPRKLGSMGALVSKTPALPAPAGTV
ncbi:MAG: hypothetical protein U0441_14860 [Polyangiaceae bacterium]